MSRNFTTVDYEATLGQQVRLEECLPADHLARFIADVLGQRDFAAIYARDGARGGRAYAPERRFGLLVSGDATGVFSARKIARATYEAAPFRLLAGTRHPEHDTIATFRRAFLGERKGRFVQVLLLAQEVGVLRLGALSLDGTTIHADASKSTAVSDKRLREMEAPLAAEVETLFALGERADRGGWRTGGPSPMNLPGGRSGGRAWRRRRRSVRRAPRSGTRRRRRRRRPSCRSARPKPAGAGDRRAASRLARRRRDRATTTRTPSPTPTRAS